MLHKDNMDSVDLVFGKLRNLGMSEEDGVMVYRSNGVELQVMVCKSAKEVSYDVVGGKNGKSRSVPVSNPHFLLNLVEMIMGLQ